MLLSDQPVGVRTPPRRARRSSLAVVLALVMAVGVVVGFGYEVPEYIIYPTVVRPMILWVHSLAMLAWVGLFLTQALFVRRGLVHLHRRLGLFGIALAIILPPLMVMVSYTMDQFNHATFPGSDRLFLPFVVVQVNAILAFTALAWIGLALRRRSELHRRLMLLAAAVVMDAPFSRIPVWLGPPGTQVGGVWAFVAVDLLIGVAVFFDWRRIGRIHRVWWYALPPVLIGQGFSVFILVVQPQWWNVFWAKVLGF